MTTHQEKVAEVLAARAAAPVTHQIILTKDDVTGALCMAACLKLGVVGGFTGIYAFKYKPDGELEAVEVTLIPSAPVPGATVNFIPPSEVIDQKDLCACCGVRPADGEVSNTAARPGGVWEWLEGTRLSSVCAKEAGGAAMAARVRARIAAGKPETNAERIVRETPQWVKDHAARGAKLGRLNRDVTEAILRAERLPAGPEAALAFREVSALEESIAGITAPDSIEGAVARQGAMVELGKAFVRLAAAKAEQAAKRSSVERLTEAESNLRGTAEAAVELHQDTIRVRPSGVLALLDEIEDFRSAKAEQAAPGEPLSPTTEELISQVRDCVDFEPDYMQAALEAFNELARRVKA